MRITGVTRVWIIVNDVKTGIDLVGVIDQSKPSYHEDPGTPGLVTDMEMWQSKSGLTTELLVRLTLLIVDQNA